MANVNVKFLFKTSNNRVSSDDSAKGTRLSLIEESYINKESEKQLTFLYNQFMSSRYVVVSQIKCKTYRLGYPCDVLVSHPVGWKYKYIGCSMLQK